MTSGNSGVTCGVRRTPLRVTHVTNTPLAFHSAFRTISYPCYKVFGFCSS